MHSYKWTSEQLPSLWQDMPFSYGTHKTHLRVHSQQADIILLQHLLRGDCVEVFKSQEMHRPNYEMTKKA